ncbi:MAG: thiol reductant ABC exporter subunit CydD [Acetobacteraceae bacterium]|nr:thiol reductant ABC exporter subunit CydD [Acetobacteraceae bacterium]
MSDLEATKAAARAWVKREQRAGVRPVRPVIALGLLGTVLAIGQAFCIASILTGTLAAPALAGFAVFAVLRAGLGYAADRYAFAAGASARRRLRTDILTRLFWARPTLARARHSGDLAAIVVDKIEALDGLFARFIPTAVLALAAPLLVAAVVLFLDPTAGAILVLTGLLAPAAMGLSGLGAAAAAREQFVAMTRLQTRFLDRIRGIATIVLHGRGEDEATSLGRAADELRVRTMRVLRLAFLSSAALDLAAALALVLLALRYGQQWHEGTLTDPRIALMVLLLTPEFFAPLRAVSAAYQDMFHATAAAESLVDVPPVPAPPPIRDIRTVETHGVSVQFEDVRLTWDKSRGPALNGLSFRVPAGETVLLAGPSGAGKSSAIELLMGFVRPDSGRVVINGRDIADLVPQALSAITAWIGQRPVLFSGTIRENIRFARPDATAEQFAEALRAARVDGFTEQLPDGLDTVVGEGGYGLSGGQAQRIAIARAFLKNAPLLLLDEPTAHLDPATESEVFDGLRRLAAGRTVILATHAAAARTFSGRRLDIRDGRIQPARGAA